MNASEQYDLMVIGGGASGMMAAGVAASKGLKVLLLEKNSDLGEKLKITGGGRCNITHYEIDNQKLLDFFGDAKPYLHSPFAQFSVKESFTFFERKSLPLVVESRNRVFPKSQRAFDVYTTMKDFIKKHGVTIKLRHPVIGVTYNDNTIMSVKTPKGVFSADNYIIATGGFAYPETGSTGDGFSWVRDMGHTVVPSSPDIVPLKSDDQWVKRISGTELSFMKITFFNNYERAFSKTGKILFTHFGLSSPLILNSAKEVNDLLKKGHVHAEIDCFPDTNKGQLDKRIIKLMRNNANKDVKNVLPELIPSKLASEVIAMLRLPDPHTKAHSLSVEKRKRLRDLLKALPVSISGLMGMDRAVIADGGVPLDEVETRTMQSKVMNNLYLTGDMLHINRPSGGFSLQMCWTTGYVAAQAVASKKRTINVRFF